MQYGNFDLNAPATGTPPANANSGSTLDAVNAYIRNYYATKSPLQFQTLPTLHGLNNTEIGQDSVEKQNKGKPPKKQATIMGAIDNAQKMEDNIGKIPVKLENLAHPLLALFQNNQDVTNSNGGMVDNGGGSNSFTKTLSSLFSSSGGES